MNLSETVLVIPPNDAEAIMISNLADAIGLPIIRSGQTHGASIDKGKDVIPQIKKGKYKRVIIVEMPGVKTEAKLRELGIDLMIIDHHHYTGLDRAHDPKGEMLPSSLEQFLKLFRLTDVKLKALGFNPRLVRAIGIVDRGYYWALQEEGYNKKEMQQVMVYQQELMAPLINPQTEARKERAAQRAWKTRVAWKGYWIVRSRADVQLRPRLSRIVLMEIGKPTSLIILEESRHLVYVQETPHAMELFRVFGGFTFGLDHNWGYRNEPGKKHVGLKQIKAVLSAAAVK